MTTISAPMVGASAQERAEMAGMVRREITRQQAMTRRAMAAEAERVRMMEKRCSRMAVELLGYKRAEMAQRPGLIERIAGHAADCWVMIAGTAIAWGEAVLEWGVRWGLWEWVENDDA